MVDLIGPGSGTSNTGSSINSTTTRPALYRIFGAIDTWFRDCSTPASQDGTAYQADFFNGLLGQLRTLIRGNGQLQSAAGPVVPEVNTSDSMLLTAVQLLIARGQPNAGADTGSADALAVGPATPWPEYVKGARIWVIKNAAAGPNATTTPSLAVSGLAPVTIVRRDGSALLPNDLPLGAAFCAEYDGVAFRLVSLTWGEIAAAVQSGKWLYGVATGTANAATVQLFPQQAPVDGQEILVKWPGTNTVAAPTFLFTGFLVKTPVRLGGGTIQPGDMSGYVPLVYDGTLATWRVNGLVLSDILALGGVVRVTDSAAASTAQALVGTASPAISAYSPSQIIIFTAGANNTAANPTLNVTGAGGTALGALTIVRRDLSAIAAGDLIGGTTYIGSPDAVGSKLRLLSQASSDTKNILNVGPITVRLITAGAQTWTPPAGVTSIFAQARGGGGGGGGNQSSGAGGGGGGGAYEEGYLTCTPGTPMPVNVGSGGPGGSGNTSPANGTAGGTSSISNGTSTVSAAGGASGAYGPSGGQGVAGAGGNPISGTYGTQGGSGTSGALIGSTGLGGQGGAGAYGGGPGGGSSTGLANAGLAPGGGGAGGAANYPGASGANGEVKITYWV